MPPSKAEKKCVKDGSWPEEGGERYPFAVVVGTYVIIDGGRTKDGANAKDGANVEARGDAAKDEQGRRLNRLTSFFEKVRTDALIDFEEAFETVKRRLTASFEAEWAKRSRPSTLCHRKTGHNHWA